MQPILDMYMRSIRVMLSNTSYEKVDLPKDSYKLFSYKLSGSNTTIVIHISSGCLYRSHYIPFCLTGTFRVTL